MQGSNKNHPLSETYLRQERERTNVSIEIDGYPKDSWEALKSVVLQSSPSNNTIFEVLDNNKQVIKEFPSAQAAREWLSQNRYIKIDTF
ncbi:hypothetical protein H6F78_20175 [Coleofasciculus sp. FACHB-64]|uniref:hypothetical protein n=1 Tax=Cyanophyceae TaxID=3028117 RepID=UPI001684AF35|nr:MULTISPECIES: hypothetical protein [unclassified Coleofasciculus]MBD1878959.1 hypothetical protein [Coleofasciculus sp. FACHB-T130]MBD2047878.1 hypothetical protein [Coleofasciculus sp. FACHB-64]